MYEIIRRLTAGQLAFEQLPLLLVALGIAGVFYKFHNFLFETGASLRTWLGLGALQAAVTSMFLSSGQQQS